MLVPVITSTGTPASSSTFSTPMWACPRAPERSGAQPGKAPSLANSAALRVARFEHTQTRIFPCDGKQPVAPGAYHALCTLTERRAGAAARAHAVGRPPARRRMLRVGEPGHDGPHRRTKREDLEEGARHRDRLPVHLEDAFARRRADHAVPRAASHVTAGADSSPSPLFCVRHDRPPEQNGGVTDRVALGARQPVWRRLWRLGWGLGHIPRGQVSDPSLRARTARSLWFLLSPSRSERACHPERRRREGSASFTSDQSSPASGPPRAPATTVLGSSPRPCSAPPSRAWGS